MITREQQYENYCSRHYHRFDYDDLDEFVLFMNSTIDNFDKPYKKEEPAKKKKISW